jgi:hypothetical protein
MIIFTIYNKKTIYNKNLILNSKKNIYFFYLFYKMNCKFKWNNEGRRIHR